MSLQAISLVKDQKVDITKSNPGLTKISVGLGWDTNSGNGASFDLDAFVVSIDSAGEKQEIIFYNHLKSDDGAVVHTGDNLTGDGDGDDEVINIDFTKVTPGITKYAIAVDIFKAEERGQSFGMVKNAYVRVFNTETTDEILRYDLSEDASNTNGFLFGTVYNHNGEWKFESNSAPHSGDVNQIAAAI